jgi:hypothetical protein
MKRTAILLIIALCPAFLRADGSATTASNTLKLARGARPAAMAGAYTALADDAQSLSWNPAGLSALRDMQISINHLSHLGDIQDESIAFAKPIYGMGAFGLGVDYLYASDQYRDNWGNAGDTFSIYDFSVMAALAVDYRPFSFGLNYKLMRQGYADTFSMGSGFDAGIQARRLLSNRLNLGIALQHFGTPMSLGDTVSQLPMTWRFGGAWFLMPDWSLQVEFSHQPIEFFNKWHFGTEYTYRMGEQRAIVRGGWTQGPEGVLGVLAGASLGAGWGWKGVQFDYAASSLGDLGLSHRAGLTYSFGVE